MVNMMISRFMASVSTLNESGPESVSEVLPLRQ